MTSAPYLRYTGGMSLASVVPLAEVNPTDAGPSFLDEAAKVNFVNETVTVPPVAEGAEPYTYSIKQYVEDYVWGIIKDAKQRRLPLEQEWMAIQRMVVLQHDEGQKYKGRSNAYLPVYARSRKTIVSSLTRGLFPSDDYMDVADREQGDTEASKACKAVIEYEFEGSGLRRTIKAFLGQLCDLGVTVAKATFRSNRIFKGKKTKASAYAEAMSAVNGEGDLGLEEDCDEGVDIRTRSMFNVIVYPETAENKRELQLEAERLEVPIAYVESMHRGKRWLNVKDALAAGGGGANDEFDWVNQSVLSDATGIPSTITLRGRDGSPVQSVIVVEAWTRIRIPKKYLSPKEDPEHPVPVRVVFVNGVAVCVTRNPFYHQSSPFVYARDNQIAGSFYGDGAGRLTRDLQYLANDSANQMNDCASHGMNPVVLINTNYMVGTPKPIAPGRAYTGRDIDKMMKFERPPVEIIQYGQTHLGGLVAMAQDASGAPPVLQGNKASNTATGTQVLQNNANGPLQDQVEDIEADAMVPLMEMTWELSRQYRTQKFFLQLGEKPAMAPNLMTGVPEPVMDPQTGQPMMVPDIAAFVPSAIKVKPKFKFLASSQATNRQMRQQGLMTFTDLLTKLAPFLQMQGKMPNAEEIARRAWSDGLGFRGFQRVIIPMPMMPMAPPPGEGGGPPGEKPRGDGASVVPQGNVPGVELNDPSMGEGEEHQPVRAEVEAVTATQGQQPPNIPY